MLRIAIAASSGITSELIREVISRFRKFRKMTHGSGKIKRVGHLNDSRVKKLKPDYKLKSFSKPELMIKMSKVVIVIWDGEDREMKQLIKEVRKSPKTKVHIHDTGYHRTKKEV